MLDKIKKKLRGTKAGASSTARDKQNEIIKKLRGKNVKKK